MNRQLLAHSNTIKGLQDKDKAHEAQLKVLQDSNKLLEEYCFGDAEEAEVPDEETEAPAQPANKKKAKKNS